MAGCERQEPPLLKYWAIPDFTLTERSGKPFGLADLEDRVWLADFFFTTCPGTCPMLSSRLSEIHRELGPEPDARFVSISTDPEKDTPEVLRQYAQRFGADDRWFFLTGAKDAIWALSRDGFKLAVAENPGAPEPITHSTKLVLVDRKGMVRGFYEGVGGEGAERIVRDMRRLLKEPAR